MERLYDIVPDEIADVIRTRLNADKLCELRIRNGFPVRVCYDGVYKFLCGSGLTGESGGAIIAGKNTAENIILRACNHSLYTVTDTLKCGYVSVAGGIRIGVCGNAVSENGKILTVKDFTSVNIRLPHQVKGCASAVVPKLIDGGSVCNTLVISPPGAGKTTLLRDLCRLLCERNFNVLLCDEKRELAAVNGAVPTLDVGCADIMSGARKAQVFEAGVAYMCPHVIIADELFPSDLEGVLRAVHCGVSVIASVHAQGFADFSDKPEFVDVIDSDIFERFVCISSPPLRRVEVLDGRRTAL